MNEAFVRYQLLPGGRRGGLAPEDLIGRANRAALRIDDPRISEFHAAVSIRGGALSLLALRGALMVDGRLVQAAELHVGTRVHLARDIVLVVEHIGQQEQATDHDGMTPTEKVDGFFPPMRIECRYETVRIQLVGQPSVTLGGNYARILTELAEFGRSVPWTVLAEQIWRAADDAKGRAWLRDRYDRTIARLRRKLLHNGLPTDLVRLVNGEIELVVRPEDEVDTDGG